MLIPARCLREIGAFKPELLRGQDYDAMLALARRYRGVSTRVPTFVMRNHGGTRGPAIERHSEARRLAMWARYDRLIILPYRHTLALSEYLPRPANAPAERALTPAETVAALLTRSRIMFSHGLFAQGLEDIDLIGAEWPLTPAQLDAVREVVRHAANIEKPHYLNGAPLMARRIAKKNYPRHIKYSLIQDTLKGLYWSFLRFSRHRRAADAARILYAIALLAPRRIKLVG